MSWYDGMAVDIDAAFECVEKLSDSAEIIGKSKTITCEDYASTIEANGNATEAINSMNVNRNKIGDYLSIDNTNLQTAVNVIVAVDVGMAEQYQSIESQTV